MSIRINSPFLVVRTKMTRLLYRAGIYIKSVFSRFSELHMQRKTVYELR